MTVFWCLFSKEAIKFSFLLGVPLLIGAGIFEILTNPLEFSISLLPLIAGILITIVTTYFSVKFLLNILRKGKLWYFGIYCILLGIIVFCLGMFL